MEHSTSVEVKHVTTVHTTAQREEISRLSPVSLTHSIVMKYLRIDCDELEVHMIYLKATTERGAAGGGVGGNKPTKETEGNHRNYSIPKKLGKRKDKGE